MLFYPKFIVTRWTRKKYNKHILVYIMVNSVKTIKCALGWIRYWHGYIVVSIELLGNWMIKFWMKLIMKITKTSMHRSKILDNISKTAKISRYMVIKQIGSPNMYCVMARGCQRWWNSTVGADEGAWSLRRRDCL